MSNKKEIEKTYLYLINNTELKEEKIFDCLHILSTKYEDIKKNYEYLYKNLGFDFINKCPSVLALKNQKIKDFYKFFQTKLSIDLLKKIGGTIIVNGNLDDIKENLKESYFNYDKKTKTINNNITLDLLKLKTSKTKDYIKIIEKYNLEPENIPNKEPQEIIDIIELPYWKDLKFFPLLTSSVFTRSASQISKIFELPYWKYPKYQNLLCSSIYMKDAESITKAIEFCNNNGLEELLNNKTIIFQLNIDDFIKKVNYLKSNGEEIIIDGKINSVFKRNIKL